jgi:hypothetical protein
MKSCFVAVFSVVLALFFMSCSPNRIIGEDNESVAPAVGKKAVAHFSVNFGTDEFDKSLAKIAKIGDGLTVADRQSILAYRKSKVKSISVVFYKTVNPDGSAYSAYVFRFPVINGIASGEMEVFSGHYDEIYFSTSRDTSERVLMSADFFQKILDYTVDTGSSELKVNLKQNQALQAYISIATNPSLFEEGKNYQYGSSYSSGFASSWGSDLLYSQGKLFWSCDVQIAKFNSLYTVGGVALQSFFDVMKIIDNDTIEMNAQAQTKLSLDIGFIDDQTKMVDSVFPKDGATNVPTNIQSIVIYFSGNIADLSDMPGAQFGVASADGSDQIAGTCSLSSNFFARNLDNGTSRVYLKPNTTYIAHVSAVKDEYGNEIAEKKWVFKTGAN